eukprot:NODE_3648_length_387_cov_76.470414_g3085_i0.p2 GENE.NODE_3648_length_387_cov_76.470414_g3085_i0~~NODE_3648_length_387_cov_76.470414_g3085_i0.p2  ORF type:complete len:128 (+),score=27.58 NODE_3648_length_387_cov_76.470414_g3085_i0:30-386(+)
MGQARYGARSQRRARLWIRHVLRRKHVGHAEGLSVRLSFDHGRRSLVVTKVIAEEWHEHGPRRSVQGTHEAFKAAFGVHHFARRKPGEKADLDSGGRAAGAHREDMQELRHGDPCTLR